MPDAPRNRAARSGHVPQVWHGARAEGRDGRGLCGGDRGARRHAAALSCLAAVHGPALLARDGRDGAGRSARPRDRARSRAVRAARARRARGALGGQALLRAGGRLDRAPLAEHVHAHRPRDARRVRLQLGGHVRARSLPRVGARARRGRGRLLRGVGRHHHARLARTGARAARAGAYGRRGARALAPRAEDRAARHRQGRRGRAHREGARRGSPARAAGRARAHGRRDRRRQLRRRRVDDHG